MIIVLLEFEFAPPDDIGCEDGVKTVEVKILVAVVVAPAKVDVAKGEIVVDVVVTVVVDVIGGSHVREKFPVP